MGTVLDEVPVQIRQRQLVGGLFVAFILLIPLLFLELFIRFYILEWIISLSFLSLFIYVLAKINDARIKAGPAKAWFRRGMLNAWVSLDGEDLVVRTIWGGEEAYKPSRIDWTMPQAFTVREGETSFDLVFQTRDDAARFAARMKTNIPSIVESSIL